MARTHYVALSDVLRKFDPTLTEQALVDESLFAANDREKILSRLEGVESEFEDETGHAWRSVRVGAPGHQETYESYDSDYRRYQRGVKIWLDHPDVVPLDPSDGDALLIRTGRNTWRDVTALEGDMWRANYPNGMVKLHTVLRYLSPWRGGDSDAIRVCYRYGALGGDRDRGGETTLTDTVGTGDTVFPVDNVARLPGDGILLVGGKEYVSLDSVNYETDELTVTRGVRGTSASDHDPDTVIGYCPTRIREAIAAQTAVEMVLYDDMADNLSAPNDSVTHRDRLDSWQDDWDSAIRKHAQARML